MSLFDIVLVAKSLIQHGSDLLDRLEIVVGQHVGEIDNQLSAITDNFAKKLLLVISQDLNHRCKDQTEKGINHWNRRESSS